jgi:hypothetical protein
MCSTNRELAICITHLDFVLHQEVKQKIIITSPGPVLPGTISTAHAKCGKATCRCQQDPIYLHEPYHRRTGWINGKPTTKTVSEGVARECQKRIENYKELQKRIEKTIAGALDQAPSQESIRFRRLNRHGLARSGCRM